MNTHKEGMLEVEYEPYPDPQRLHDLRREMLTAGTFPFEPMHDEAVFSLYKERYGAQAIISPLMVRQAARLESYTEMATNNLVMRLTIDVFGKRLMSVRSPDTWWDAFKERWFPKWALTQWPVVYRRWDMVALQPFFHAPADESVVTWIQR